MVFRSPSTLAREVARSSWNLFVSYICRRVVVSYDLTLHRKTSKAEDLNGVVKYRAHLTFPFLLIAPTFGSAPFCGVIANNHYEHRKQWWELCGQCHTLLATPAAGPLPKRLHSHTSRHPQGAALSLKCTFFFSANALVTDIWRCLSTGPPSPRTCG